VAPLRDRFGLYFDLHLRNITGAEVITFLRYLLRRVRGSVVVASPTHEVLAVVSGIG